MNVIRICFSLILIALIAKWGYMNGTAEHRDVHLLPSSGASLMTGNLAGFTAGKATNTSRFSINGLPAEVEAFHSEQSPEAIMRDYQQDWQLQGLASEMQSVAGMKIISALDEAANHLETVIAMPVGGRTMVVPARLDLGSAPSPSKPNTPLLPGATQIYHIESDDGAGYSENLILSSSSSVSTVLNFYKSRFTAEGWQMQDPGGGLPPGQYSQSLFFARGNDERWVIAERPHDNAETMVFLLYQDK